MEKKAVIGKIFGKIFCTISIIILICVTAFYFYYSGQIKSITKLYNAVKFDIYDDYTNSFVGGDDIINPDELTALQEMYQEKFGVDVGFSVDFIDRNRVDKNKYEVAYELTVYSDEKIEKSTEIVEMELDGLKWKIIL